MVSRRTDAGPSGDDQPVAASKALPSHILSQIGKGQVYPLPLAAVASVPHVLAAAVLVFIWQQKSLAERGAIDAAIAAKADAVAASKATFLSNRSASASAGPRTTPKDRLVQLLVKLLTVLSCLRCAFSWAVTHMSQVPGVL